MLMCCDEETLWHTDIISRLGSGDGWRSMYKHIENAREREREPSLSKGSEREERRKYLYERACECERTARDCREPFRNMRRAADGEFRRVANT